MGLKPDPCYEKAAANEPVFVLRAQDRLAPAIVRAWAGALAAYQFQEGVTPERLDKVREALKLADEMERWQETHAHKMPD